MIVNAFCQAMASHYVHFGLLLACFVMLHFLLEREHYGTNYAQNL